MKNTDLQAAQSAAPRPRPTGLQPSLRLSVIVPIGPDETQGAVLVDQLQALAGDAEIVVASTYGHPLPTQLKPYTREVPVRACTAAAGRAPQMNASARAAHGRWLWFVHADSRLHARTLAALNAFLTDDPDALGYFDLRYRGDGPWLTRLNALGANLRARWLGMPFGDQGLVIPSRRFQQLGGYDENVACGEDHLLVWKARIAGLALRRIGAPLFSSSRRYSSRGWLRTTLQNLDLTAKQAWPQWRALRRQPRRQRT